MENKKNKILFIVFICISVALALINIVRSIIVLASNFSYIVNAPGYVPSDVTNFFFSTIFGGAIGVILVIASIVCFIIAVVFGIRYMRDSDLMNVINNEVKAFSSSMKETKNKFKQGIKKQKIKKKKCLKI